MAGNTVKEMTKNFEKLDKFEGHDFRRWQKKMYFLLTTLKVVYVLTTPMPELLEDATMEAIRIRAKWENDDYIFRGQIFNDESISVSSIIDKLPPSWKDFKHTLKHGKDDLSLVQLGSYLRVEESLKAQDSDKGKGKEVGRPSVNMIEEGGFGYYNNGMFMLNLNKVHDDSNFVYMSSSTVVNSSLWHARLGHVHYKRMLEMYKDDLIPAIDENMKKCTTCMLTKITRKPFQSITRKSVILELIHSDLCDFQATPSLGNKKNVITFIDDASRFCYVYLLHAKDEALDKFRIYKTEVELQQNDLVKTLRIDRGGEYYDPVFFNRAIVRLPDPKRKILGEKGIDCIFVGYVEHSKAYRFYIIEHNDSVSINSIIESRDAIFDENRFSSIPRPKDIIPNSDESQRDDHSDDVPMRFLNLVKEDPRTYNEAMQSRDSAFQKEAIGDEIGSIMKNNTWVLSDLPPGCKPLGCKCIFKRKMKVDGTIDKFKARLVIQGFRQKEGIEYFDTYAPVARITTVRLMLALAAIHNLVIHQMDVKTAFLNGDLEEEVYIEQPKGFVMQGNEHKVFDKTKKFLSSRFSMKHMEEADVILGIKIKRENKGIIITQSHYIEKILKKFNREDCSPVSTLMDPVEKLKLNTGAISWALKKQTCITGSTMESKFVALAAAVLPQWLGDIVRYTIGSLLGVKHSMVRELIRNGVISIEFVRTQHNLADHLTKGLAKDLLDIGTRVFIFPMYEFRPASDG
nr:zinc finger, CCHC-type [Tanacetum cinerariifolium]